MVQKIKQLVEWLNTFDDKLIFRLGGEPFVCSYNPQGYYEIKNNLGRILVKPENSFGISFTDGWSYFTTLPKGFVWDEQVKKEILLHKSSLFLTVLPSNQIGWYHPVVVKLRNFWRPRKIKSLTWEHITAEEVLKYILPSLQKMKQDQREGHHKNYPYEIKIKEIKTQLQAVKQSPQIAQLVALLET